MLCPGRRGAARRRNEPALRGRNHRCCPSLIRVAIILITDEVARTSEHKRSVFYKSSRLTSGAVRHKPESRRTRPGRRGAEAAGGAAGLIEPGAASITAPAPHLTKTLHRLEVSRADASRSTPDMARATAMNSNRGGPARSGPGRNPGLMRRLWRVLNRQYSGGLCSHSLQIVY
ncbi:hypothetical protein EVAR_33071_1 [Eumeta japonica]|uniref:Uncharacterized protein n=1 Tax=Eumeta variegata TaxID=151549 RepID=A0A4C1WVE7_EUMVA|nr:hypothetical protein EVAR_33071_1 [Eumeta japonica]